MSEQKYTSKTGQQYEPDSISGFATPIYYCRMCALKMYEPNKGFGYRCAPCHEKAEGWC
jgi:hypothetical protein|tara:strand:+ start:5473 stop:5649 length:177 start_codon:yes stop_codon:yes gene_type:complete